MCRCEVHWFDGDKVSKWSPAGLLRLLPQPPECGITGMHYHTRLRYLVPSHSQEDVGQGFPADETILRAAGMHTSTTGNYGKQETTPTQSTIGIQGLSWLQ